VSVFATAPCGHTQMLGKGADVVAAAISEMAGQA
jgi:hypothetical protein